MNNLHLRLSLLVLTVLLLFLPLVLERMTGSTSTSSTVTQLSVRIDARNLTRGILHSRISIPVTSGELKLWFPKWIPGIHAPRGAIQNLAGLIIHDQNGQRLRWHRDTSEVHRFLMTIPNGVDEITVDFDYICNQPSVNSIGVDSFGDQIHGVMSWNNVLMYPEGPRHDQIHISAEIHAPENWKLFTALPHTVEKGLYTFDSCSLRTCMDSPVIGGRYHRSYDLHQDGKPVYLHCVGDNDSSVSCPEPVINGMRHLVTESRLLFQCEHYDAYHFLLLCSNSFPRIGLEHLASSLNGVNASDLPDGAKGATRVMAHEYMHSWCGKYRRPAGMLTANYHEPKDTTLLWVYEGLTQYLCKVLLVRSGLRSETDFRELLHYYISYLRITNGRRWRSLADTATSSYLLRGGSNNWSRWVRGQDYYNEGALIWLEADTLIRHLSKGQRSLDDFCRAFFAPQGDDPHASPYTYEELLATLQEIQPYDWQAFFQQRVYQEQEELSLDLLQYSGWEAGFEQEPDAAGREKLYYYRNTYESIGVGFSDSGRIYRVLKESPAYNAGLVRNMQVMTINGNSFSPVAVHNALLESQQKQKPLTLKVHDDDHISEFSIDYTAGPRYLVLRRKADSEDRLSSLLQGLRPDQLSDDASQEATTPP